jgi:uncharacterized membrane protein
MDRPSSTPDREFAPPALKAPAGGAKGWGPRGIFISLRTQLISGLIFTLPIVITFWIVYWIFLTLERFLLNPVAYIIHRIHAWMRNYPAFQELTLPDWWYNIASPVLAIVLMLVILYGMGLFFRSWVYRTLDWLLLHVPIVATIYRAVRNVVNSLGAQLRGGADFKRVVLVPFPHPGARSLAFVTNSLHDVSTGRTILTVCVLTGVMPPAGFTLFVPEESVTNIAWSANDTLQAILSGGINAPPTIHFFEGLSTPLQDIGGALVDVKGHTLRSVPAAADEDAS